MFVDVSILCKVHTSGKNKICGIPVSFEETLTHCRARPVINEMTGKVYPSVKNMAEELGVGYGAAINALKHGWHVKGQKVRYADRERPESPRPKRNLHRNILCVDTGEVFETLSRAAKSIGVTPGGLMSSIQRGYRVYGKRYEFGETAF